MLKEQYGDSRKPNRERNTDPLWTNPVMTESAPEKSGHDRLGNCHERLGDLLLERLRGIRRGRNTYDFSRTATWLRRGASEIPEGSLVYLDIWHVSLPRAV